jgi:hypothetical protein
VIVIGSLLDGSQRRPGVYKTATLAATKRQPAEKLPIFGRHPANFAWHKSPSNDGELTLMFSVLSLLSGAALAGLVYGFSFLPSATLTRCDDIECTGEDRSGADMTADATKSVSEPDVT